MKGQGLHKTKMVHIQAGGEGRSVNRPGPFSLLLNVFLAIKLPFHHHTYVTINKIFIVVIFIFIPSSIPAEVFGISADHKLVFHS